MVKAKKVSENKEVVKYEYYPEGYGSKGEIVFDKVNKTVQNVDYSSDDYGNAYSKHALRKIIDFSEEGKFLEEFTVMWY